MAANPSAHPEPGDTVMRPLLMSLAAIVIAGCGQTQLPPTQPPDTAPLPPEAEFDAKTATEMKLKGKSPK